MMDCIPRFEYPAQTSTINPSCAPGQTEHGLTVSETEKDVAEKPIICHHSRWENTVGGLLGTICDAENTPRLYSCCFLGVFQETERNILTDCLGKALCGTALDGLLHQPLDVVAGYFF